MKALIGYTGFVGSNLNSESVFDYKYNSKNIEDIKGKSFDLSICSAVRAEMWFANKFPEEDKKEIDYLISYLDSFKTKTFVLISTIGVYKNPINVNEETSIISQESLPYGRNRYYLEEYVKNKFKNYLIVRLPALFGINIKKNFIYDLINRVPAMLVESKFNELMNISDNSLIRLIKQYYHKDSFGFYVLEKNIDNAIFKELKNKFENYGFTSLNFTHRDSQFQFYYLKNLWKDIQIALKNNISILNISSEPIKAYEIAKSCFGVDFDNNVNSPLIYDMKSKYDYLYDGKNGYLYNKPMILSEIQDFVKGQ